MSSTKRPEHVTRFRVVGTQSDAHGATVVYDETILSKRPAEALSFAEDEIGRRFLDGVAEIRWWPIELACVGPKGGKHKRFIGSEKLVMLAMMANRVLNKNKQPELFT